MNEQEKEERIKKIQTNKAFYAITSLTSFEEVKNTHLVNIEPVLTSYLDQVQNPTSEEDIKDKQKLEKDLLFIANETKGVSKKDVHTDDTLKNISHFARVIATVHPAFEWQEFDTTAFKQEIVALYQNQKEMPEEQRMPVPELLKDFTRITQTTLKDNHLGLSTPEGRKAVSHEEAKKLWGDKALVGRKQASVGKNVASTPPTGYEILDYQLLEGMEKEEGSLLIAEQEIKGKKVGVVAFNTCEVVRGTNHPSQWASILETFENHYKNWDSVIIDVRGNGGGDNYQLKEIAEKLYGNTVPYCSEAKRRTSPEADLQKIGFGCGQEQELWTAEKYPFKGKEGTEIFILADKHVGSAAEAVLPMLKPHPKAKIVGENSGGNCQFGGIVPIYLPCGGRVNLGSVGRRYGNEMIETQGHTPDVQCQKKEDAFEKAISLIKPKGNKRQPLNLAAFMDKAR